MERIPGSPARREKDKGGQVIARQKENWQVIAELNSAGEACDAHARVLTPSRRLSCMIEIFYIPLGSLGAHYIVDYEATWKIKAQALSPTANNYVDLHEVLGAAAGNTAAEYTAPNAYELDSAIRVCLVTLETNNLPELENALRVAGRWFIRARWEPNTPMDDAELETLFNGCNLAASKVVT